MLTYRIAQPEDMPALLDFINMVFSMVRRPHDFASLLPKAYSDAHSQPEIHVIAVEDGRIVGCLGMLRFPLEVCGHRLRLGYLGSMSVHPCVRGQGVMKELVHRQIAIAQAEGLDMLALGGQRQRYQHYGFETCGTGYHYSLTAANMRHALPEETGTAFTFRPMAEADVPFAFGLYAARPVTGARTAEGFLPCLRSFQHNPQLVLRQGTPVGYFTLLPENNAITELAFTDAALVLPALKAWMLHTGTRSLRVEAAPQDVSLNRLLAPVCEGFTVADNAMYRLLRPETVLPAYMSLQATLAPLADGHFTAQLADLGAYTIAVEGDQASVTPAEKATLALDAFQMHQLFFGCNPFGIAADIRQQVPSGWFPLPLHIPYPDTF